MSEQNEDPQGGKLREMTDDSLRETFERVYSINLVDQPDRWQSFLNQVPGDWPFEPIRRYDAVNGKLCPPPSWWRPGKGAWGCMRSHVGILEECLNAQVRSVLVLEDDALFPPDFTRQVRTFLEYLPDDWQLIYLGGQHLKFREEPPIRINDWVYQPYNVNRSHAYAVRGEMIKIVYSHLAETKSWNEVHHLDHHMGQLHQRREHRIYTPREWLVGQMAGVSTIARREFPDRFWLPAREAVEKSKERFVAVVGLHRSGAGNVAKILQALGVHMGKKLVRESGLGSGTAAGLAQICERALPFPSREFRQPLKKVRGELESWVRARQREAAEQGTIAGAKHASLCAMLEHLREICGKGLRVITVNRPPEQCNRSLRRQLKMSGKRSQVDATQIREVQRWLSKQRRTLPADVPQLTIKYDHLLAHPDREVDRIIEFLELTPAVHQREAAVRYVDASQRHVHRVQAVPPPRVRRRRSKVPSRRNRQH